MELIQILADGDAFDASLQESHIFADFLTVIYLRLHQKKSSRKEGPFSDNKKDLTKLGVNLS